MHILWVPTTVAGMVVWGLGEHTWLCTLGSTIRSRDTCRYTHLWTRRVAAPEWGAESVSFCCTSDRGLCCVFSWCGIARATLSRSHTVDLPPSSVFRGAHHFFS